MRRYLSTFQQISSCVGCTRPTRRVRTRVSKHLTHVAASYRRGTKMALSGAEWSVPELTRTKAEMEAFLASKEKLEQTRALLASGEVTDDERKTLTMFERTFGCYIMESADALKLREECMKIEGTLEDSRNKMTLGATIGGEFVELSSVGLRSKMRVDPDEATRKACYDGVRTIGDFVVANGFVELVK